MKSLLALQELLLQMEESLKDNSSTMTDKDGRETFGMLAATNLLGTEKEKPIIIWHAILILIFQNSNVGSKMAKAKKMARMFQKMKFVTTIKSVK